MQSVEIILRRGLSIATHGIYVKIGGTYYHLDATFDNTLGKDRETSEIRYDYFNLDDSQYFSGIMSLLLRRRLTAVIMSTFTIRRRSFLFTKKEDVYKRSLQAAKKGRILIFHWRGGYLTRAVLEELLDLMKKAGEDGKRQRGLRLTGLRR